MGALPSRRTPNFHNTTWLDRVEDRRPSRVTVPSHSRAWAATIPLAGFSVRAHARAACGQGACVLTAVWRVVYETAMAKRGVKVFFLNKRKHREGKVICI